MLSKKSVWLKKNKNIVIIIICPVSSFHLPEKLVGLDLGSFMHKLILIFLVSVLPVLGVATIHYEIHKNAVKLYTFQNCLF